MWYIPAHALYIFPAILGYFVFLPFFRRGHIRLAYEYLELRYGTWAQLTPSCFITCFPEVLFCMRSAWTSKR